jgi:hypothetical protein
VINGISETVMMKHSRLVLGMISESPERFYELSSSLPPIIQDIFYQYYVLGRTYGQIGRIVFPEYAESTAFQFVKLGKEIGLRALAGVVKYGPKRDKRRKLQVAVRIICMTKQVDFEQFNPRSYLDLAWAYQEYMPKSRELRVRAGSQVGRFVVSPDSLSELCAPSWSVFGPRVAGGVGTEC